MEQDTQLTTAWRSPSNIAIVKYWGKHGQQFPANPSLSFTLSNAHTETRMSAAPARSRQQSCTFRFEGQAHPGFASRIDAYLKTLAPYTPALSNVHLEIDSKNSFPHSSGIASSASAMSALALCLGDLQQLATAESSDADLFLRQVSEMARLGSGSACRSIYGPACIWGRHESVSGTSDAYAIPLENIHPLFQTLQDSILIVDEGVKSVPSSAGHALMQGHVFGPSRVQQARRHLELLIPAIQQGDLDVFGQITEAEAMTLHALMMTSSPSFILMKPNTLAILDAIRSFRTETSTPVYFTLDAGPNVHLLYPQSARDIVQSWISAELQKYCAGGRVIHDHAGSGPVRI
jgi:diphosphomevalonate decarboxylase